MRSRLVTLIAIAVASVAMGFAIKDLSASPTHHPVAKASLPPRMASYLGVYEDGSPPAYQPLAEFATAAGRKPDIVGYYSGWAEPFDTSFADLMHSHGIIPFVQIDPTYASMSGIATGVYDTYLRSYADSVRDFDQAVVIGFGHEMNTTGYPWGYGRVPASTFVAAWRHVVTLFRAAGADNVTWLWTINVDEPGSGPIRDWWPGGKYVSWVGIDGYYYVPSDTFAKVFGQTIDQVRTFTSAPILLSETAVGPAAGQFVKIQNLFQGMAKYRTLGLVWFDKPQNNGLHHQDWRIEDNQSAEISFRLGVRDMMAPPITRLDYT